MVLLCTMERLSIRKFRTSVNSTKIFWQENILHEDIT